MRQKAYSYTMAAAICVSLLVMLPGFLRGVPVEAVLQRSVIAFGSIGVFGWLATRVVEHFCAADDDQAAGVKGRQIDVVLSEMSSEDGDTRPVPTGNVQKDGDSWQQ